MTEYSKSNPETIRKMFNSIARDYDRANAVLSFQMHRLWNRSLVKEAIEKSSPQTLLDLCCGTGAIAFDYLKKADKPTKVYLLDFSEEMLLYAKQRASKEPFQSHAIDYLQADAQEIPLPSESVDCVTIAYGIRNVASPRRCIDDVYRVLQPGGTFGILELTQPKNKMLRLGHDLYLKTILPIVGKMLTNNKEAYQYLCNSIHAFIQPSALVTLIKTAGFREINSHPLLGGTATLFIARK